MASLAILQPQWRADRIKLIALNNKARTSLVPGIPTALEEGYPSLVFEGLHGLIGLKTMSKEHKERIAADFKEAAADGSIGARLAATGSVMNVGGPDEFAAAIEEQRATIAATVKAINFKPRNWTSPPNGILHRKRRLLASRRVRPRCAWPLPQSGRRQHRSCPG